MHLLRAALALLALATLPGCTHTVLRSTEPPQALKPVPAQGLRASVVFSSDNRSNALVAQTIRDSGYFVAVDDATSAATDIEITFRGTDCGDARSPTDSFLGTWSTVIVFWGISVPTLFSVPPFYYQSWDCQRMFSYRLLRVPYSNERTVWRELRETQYKTFLTHPLMTSKKREQYQRERSVDDAVVALLNHISDDLAALEQSR